MNHRLILVVLLFLLLAFGCSNEQVSNQIIYDVSSESSRWIGIGSTNEVILTGMDPEYLYIIRTDGTREVNTNQRASSTNLLRVQEGFLPVPDSLGQTRFGSRNLGLGSGRIKVEQIELDSDLVIDTRIEEPVRITAEGDRVFEEYYHVDFNDSQYDQLDRSTLAILQRWEGNGRSSFQFAIVSENRGLLDTNCRGLLDLSSQDSLNLYHQFTEKEVQYPFIASLVLTTPIMINENTAVTINDPLAVYRISSNGLNPEKEYVLVFDKSAADPECELSLSNYSMAKSSSIHKTRTLAGIEQACKDNKGLHLTQISRETQSMVLYFGTLTEDYLFNWHYSNYFSNNMDVENFGTITLREISLEEKNRIHTVELQKFDGVPKMRLTGSATWSPSLTFSGDQAYVLLFNGEEEDRAGLTFTVTSNRRSTTYFSSKRGNGSGSDSRSFAEDDPLINMVLTSSEETEPVTLAFTPYP